MFVPVSQGDYEFTEKKSRFISHARRIDSPAEVKEIIKSFRKEHPAARHVVHAFAAGTRGEIQGASDDGEPAGTAGKPVLDLIKGREITNVLVLVVRYFGGIKLGTGGLVRAYGQAARGALDALAVEELQERRTFRLACGYGHYEPIRGVLLSRGWVSLEEHFGQEVEIRGAVPQKTSEDLEKQLRDICSGQLEFTWEDGSPSQ